MRKMCDHDLKHLIEKTLQNFEKDPELKISEIKESEGSTIGDNYMSVVNCVEVVGKTGSGEAYSRSLFIKKPPSDPKRCELFSVDKAFKNESIMYNDYFPKVASFEIPIPTCLHADDKVIILENLRKSGYRKANRKEGLDLTHCRLCIQALARFHASSYFLKTMKSDELDTLMSKTTAFALVGSFYSRMIENALTGCIRTLKNYEDDSAIAWVIPKIEKLVGNSLDRMVSLTQSGRLIVLCHGDFWMNNILFRYDGENVVKDLKLLDFQGPRFQSFAVDFWLFVYTSMNLPGLEMNLEEILILYSDTFVGFLKSRIPESNIPNYIDVLTELRKTQLYGFLVSIWYLPALFIDSSTAPDLEDLLSEDVSRIDFTSGRVKLPKEFDDRLLQIVKHCYRHGVFDRL